MLILRNYDLFFFSENSLIVEIVTQNKTVARRVWAQIGFPFPPRGFENRTLLNNFDYLLGLTVRKDIPAVLSHVNR